MNRVLLDVDIILDVLLDRKPYAELSAAIWAAAESEAVDGLLPRRRGSPPATAS